MAEETRGTPDISMPEYGNTKDLIQATSRSFKIIASLSCAKSDHRAVQDILGRIRSEGAKYVLSVSKSVETAQSGYAFANRAQDLCIALDDEIKTYLKTKIQYIITEMRTIAQEAHASAKATANGFRANRQEFTEIRASTSETFRNIEDERAHLVASRDKAMSQASSWKRKTKYMMAKRENDSTSLQLAKTAIYLPAIAVTASGAHIFKKQAKGRGKKAVSFENALHHLEPAERDLKQLMVEMDVLAQYWLEVDTVLEDVERRAKGLRDDDMLQMNMRSLKRNWKEVADDYKMYKTALTGLLDNNTQYARFVASSRKIAATLT